MKWNVNDRLWAVQQSNAITEQNSSRSRNTQSYYRFYAKNEKPYPDTSAAETVATAVVEEAAAIAETEVL